MEGGQGTIPPMSIIHCNIYNAQVPLSYVRVCVWYTYIGEVIYFAMWINQTATFFFLLLSLLLFLSLSSMKVL